MMDESEPYSEDSSESPPPGPELRLDEGLGLDEPPQIKGASQEAYRVLARKYRPANFEQLIGQEALVRTLTNAIEAGRIAQAFMLTGVRGVGKTTTARIVARALNCIGPDGTGGPTISPCGVCQHCTSIAEDRHVDVIEMDAASRTGVDDIRELIEGVRYRPVSARYKIYVLDEVHMLSRNAFNALLKTLEEPPEHVKFVFATTEIRKVPVTVLSRCQRFDLRRVPVDKLAAHFKDVAFREGVTIADDALGMIARAADGSVRDGLSLLDQAIALSAGNVDADRVRDMLGLADRGRIYDLFDAVMAGDAPTSLALLEDLYGVGADPVVVIEDLMDVCHFLTRAILVPEALERPTTAELERTRGKDMSAKLSLPILTRAWQMLMKGLGEVRASPSAIQAAEMVIIRLLHVANMPPPGDLVKTLKGSVRKMDGAAPAGTNPAGTNPAGTNPVGGGPSGETASGEGGPTSAMPAPRVIHSQGGHNQGAALAQAPQASINPVQEKGVQFQDFPALIAFLESKKEQRLATHLKRDVHLVSMEVGRLEFRPAKTAPADLHGQVGKVLSHLTGLRWIVSLSNIPGEETIAEQTMRKEQSLKDMAARDPLVQSIQNAFPEAQITKVTPPARLEKLPELTGNDPELMAEDYVMPVDLEEEDDL